VTVKNDGQFPGRSAEIKILVDAIDNIEFLNGDKVMANAVVEFKKEVVKESEQEAMDRIATRFEVLDEMSRACINGDIRAMIVSGPPGVGKSYGVETQMEKASMFDKLAGKRVRFQIVKGAMTALGLYTQLYKYSGTLTVVCCVKKVSQILSTSMVVLSLSLT
jgi:replicative DNA helicase